jgi:hypothetical protein
MDDIKHRDWMEYLHLPLKFHISAEDIGIDPFSLKPCAEYFVEVGESCDKYHSLVLEYRVTKEANDLYCLLDVSEDVGIAEVLGLDDGPLDGEEENLNLTQYFDKYYPFNKDVRGYVYRDKFLFPVSPQYRAFKYYINNWSYDTRKGEPIPYISLFMRVAVEIVADIKKNHIWFSDYKI